MFLTKRAAALQQCISFCIQHTVLFAEAFPQGLGPICIEGAWVIDP